MSKEQANTLPSLAQLKPGHLISNKELIKILNSNPGEERWEVHYKQYLFSQKVPWEYYSNPDQLFSSEKEMILSSLLGWSNSQTLELEMVTDILHLKYGSLLQSKIAKLEFLKVFSDHLVQLPYRTTELCKVKLLLKN